MQGLLNMSNATAGNSNNVRDYEDMIDEINESDDLEKYKELFAGVSVSFFNL